MAKGRVHHYFRCFHGRFCFTRKTGLICLGMEMDESLEVFLEFLLVKESRVALTNGQINGFK